MGILAEAVSVHRKSPVDATEKSVFSYVRAPVVVLSHLNNKLARMGWETLRDVRTEFYADVISGMIADRTLSISDNVLVVCGGALDKAVLSQAGFENVTITNLDESMSNNREDAENLSYDNYAFDIVVVHAGLHHCHSPHRALLEMYRVASKCAIAFEARYSLMMRTAVRLGFTMDYEHSSIAANGKLDGVANTDTPNFVYRWTEREVKKTIASFDPGQIAKFRFFYDLRIPTGRLAGNRMHGRAIIARLVQPLSRMLASILPRQCNEFAFAVLKTCEYQPWLIAKDHRLMSSPAPKRSAAWSSSG
jgi:SAM-dependent methyltransferase